MSLFMLRIKDIRASVIVTSEWVAVLIGLMKRTYYLNQQEDIHKRNCIYVVYIFKSLKMPSHVQISKIH